MATNPFPGYPVSRLDAKGDSKRTLETEAVARTREFVNAWADRNGTPATGPLILAVRGDYGSGKTHLLLDAIAAVESRAQADVLRVVGIQDRPLNWYRTAIGPRVAELPLADVVLQLYAKAAADIAGAAALTAGAVPALERNPGAVRDLVRDDLLSRTAVDDQFRARLEQVAEGASPNVVRAFSQLVWFERRPTAMRWIAGGELSKHEAERAGLPCSVSSDEEVSDLLVVLAGLYGVADRTLVLVIDELEHFARMEALTGRRTNMTWLKRLLQGLAPHDGVTLVAGHWDAWNVERDVLQRFEAPAIDLLRLTSRDVQRLVRRREPDATKLGPEEAGLIASLCKGNMRQVYWLLRELWSRNPGFNEPLSKQAIREAAVRTGRRLSPETALLRTHEALENLGLAVAPEQTLGKAQIRFDLVGRRGDQPVVLVQLKEAGHEIEGLDELERFLDQLGEVAGDAVDAVGVLLTEGSINDDLGPESRRRGRIVVVDATDPDIAKTLPDALLPYVSRAPRGDDRPDVPMSVAVDRIADLSRERRRLAGQVAERKQQHQRELAEKLSRNGRHAELDEFDEFDELEDLDELDDRGEHLVAEPLDYRAPLAVRYEELLDRPSLRGQLAYLTDLRSLVLLVVAGLGLAMGIAALTLPDAFDYDSQLRTILGTLGLIALLAAGGLLARELVQVNRFYDYRDRQLRLAYLRSDDPSTLLEEHNRLQTALDRGGPAWRRVLDDKHHVLAAP